MSDSDFPLPPATFEFLVFSLKMQAELRLGIVAMPGEEQDAPDLRAARHTIDMLAMVQEKTRGNLSMQEQRLIENSLTELRFRFVQVTEDVAKSKAGAKLPNEPTESNEPNKSTESRPSSAPPASDEPTGDSGKTAE
jgi:hypothetical protein